MGGGGYLAKKEKLNEDRRRRQKSVNCQIFSHFLVKPKKRSFYFRRVENSSLSNLTWLGEKKWKFVGCWFKLDVLVIKIDE